MAKASLLQRIKGFLFGGGSKQTVKKSAPRRVTRRRRDDEEESGGNNNGSVNRRELLNSLRGKETVEQKPQYKSMADATKTTSTASGLAAAIDAKSNSKPDPKEAARKASQEKARARLKKLGKAAESNLLNESEQKLLRDAKKERKEYHEATGHRYDVNEKDISKEEKTKRRIAQKNQAYDVNAEKFEVEKHPVAESFGRGALSGVSFGASELALRNSKARKESGAEEFYQKHKNKYAEGAGEIIGSLASFGATAGATEKLATKVGGRAIERGAERLAEKKIIQNAAKRSVDKAVKKGLVKEGSEELIKQVGKAKAKKIASALGTDIAQNLTTGAVYDVNKASTQHEVGSEDWWKELGKSAAFNFGITGLVAGGSALGGNKRLVAEEAMNLTRKQAVEEGADAVKNYMWGERGVGAGNLPKNKGRLFGESLDDKLGTVGKAEADEVVEATAKGTKPAAANLKTTEEVAKRSARPIEDVDRELDAVYDEIARSGDMSEERLSALVKLADDLKAERNALEEAANRKDYKVSLNRKRKTDVALPSERTAESIESQGIPSMREREYTIKAKYKSGKTYTRKVTALSEKEALDSISQNKGVKSATVVGSSEIQPNGVKPAAEKLQAKELTQEEKRNNILNYISEGDEAADATKGTKPAADTLNVLAEPRLKAIEDNPKNVDELGDHIGVKHEKVSNKEKTRDFWGSFRTKFVDSLDSYEQWNKQFLKTDPEKWAINNGAIDKLRRHQGMAVKSIDTNQLGWNGQPLKNEDGSIAKSLKAIYDGLDNERENLFERYLLLRHAPARIAEGKPIFKGTFENADKCIEEAEKILADNPDFAKRADELYRYTRNELQNRVDAGLLPQEVADDWFKRYPNYVPTGRVGEFRPDEDIWEVAHDLARNGNTVKAGEIKSAVGSDLDVRSIKEQLSEATTRNWRDMSLNNLLRRMYGEKIGKQLAVEADGGLATVLDNTVNLKSGKGGKYYAEVFIEGKANRVEIEKRFYDAIKDLNKNGRVGDAIDFASDVAAKLSTPFKNVVTSWNPIFMVKNGMRDFPEAVINSRNTKEFMECMDAARRDLYGVDGGGMWTQALRNQGVSQANFVNLEEALTKERSGVLGALGKGADKFATLQESVETYPRLVEFMATIKKLNGGTLPESLDNIPMEWLDVAAANAADVTVNFGRSGSIGKMLNRGFVPFFNPSVQGFDKFIRNLSQQPSGKALLSTITKAFALGTGVTAINNMMLSDNPYYQQIAAREKATNIIIACPLKFEDGKVSIVDADDANIFIKIPKSRFAAAYSIPMVNVANDNKMGWAEMIKVAGDQVAPVNPVESNILAPFVLAGRNKTWYGTPIVPASMEDLPKSEQYDANTSWLGKQLGKATRKLPQELQISPKKADYIMDATTGVIGDFALPMMTPSRQGGGKNPLAKAGYAAGNVVKRAFTIDANTQNDLSTRFYDSLQEANMNNKSQYGGKEDKEEYQRLSSYSTEISGINQAIRHLQNGSRDTKQKDIYELQKVRNQLMQDALDGKGVPTSEKMLDAVQKYVGTTYAVDSFGSSADKEALKVYGEAKYGNLSKEEMQKRIDSDTDFYNGVRAIGGLDDKMDKEGIKGTSVLSKAVALASANASDDMFGAYKCTKQSRTETADKMTRARNYINDGGSDEEFVQLEKARKTMGKLSDYDKDAELDKIDSQLANGEISYEEYYNKQGEIKYNANISRVGLATSLAQANAPERAYRLYDIKDRNIQKGINLAAMGYSARDYREMAKAVDTSGNGYLSKQEVVDYVANSGVNDKATLFDALYPYDIKYNPFGASTNYSVAQAADAGKRGGIASIGGSGNNFKVSADGGSGRSSYGGYYRRGYGYRRYGRRGGSSKASVPKIDAKSMAAATRSAKGTKVKLTPPTPKTKVAAPKFKKYEV